ncbi:NTTRR-F1 domain, partial [Priestia megaterium]|uniref:NTTRR-F1 domain n=1 Tax=Priestia megaterium TaxID=1404 RepID=UPI002E23DD41
MPTPFLGRKHSIRECHFIYIRKWRKEFNMSIQNLIINGGFETGTLTSWSSANTTVTSQFSHSGSFSARFQSSPFTSYIGQFVPLNP